MTVVIAISRTPLQPTIRRRGSAASRTVGRAFATIAGSANASTPANSAPAASAPRLPVTRSENDDRSEDQGTGEIGAPAHAADDLGRDQRRGDDRERDRACGDPAVH